MGQFAIENIQNEWKVYVKKPLDREEKDNYLLNITATDGTFATKAVVEVKVLDANDNSPVCEKVGKVLYLHVQLLRYIKSEIFMKLLLRRLTNSYSFYVGNRNLDY